VIIAIDIYNQICLVYCIGYWLGKTLVRFSAWRRISLLHKVQKEPRAKSASYSVVTSDVLLWKKVAEV
jgi:hypothetical protein